MLTPALLFQMHSGKGMVPKLTLLFWYAVTAINFVSVNVYDCVTPSLWQVIRRQGSYRCMELRMIWKGNQEI